MFRLRHKQVTPLSLLPRPVVFVVAVAVAVAFAVVLAFAFLVCHSEA